MKARMYIFDRLFGEFDCSDMDVGTIYPITCPEGSGKLYFGRKADTNDFYLTAVKTEWKDESLKRFDECLTRKPIIQEEAE